MVPRGNGRVFIGQISVPITSASSECSCEFVHMLLAYADEDSKISTSSFAGYIGMGN